MLRDSDGDYNKYFDAVQYAIVNFGVLLGDSVDAAIKLIYLCKNMSLFRKTNHIIACVKRCFEYIIFNDVGFDMGIMIGLLKKLDSKELGELKDYFDKRLIYINDKYPGLAKKIEELS